MPESDYSGNLPLAEGNNTYYIHAEDEHGNVSTVGPFNKALEAGGFEAWGPPVKLANPATTPGGEASAIALNPTGELIAVGQGGSPFLRVYSRSGTTLTLETPPSATPTNRVNKLRFSPDGEILASVGFGNRLDIYSVASATLTRLANPATMPGSFAAYGVSWKPDSSEFALGSPDTEKVFRYSRSGTTFAKLAAFATQPGDRMFDTAYSPDGAYLAAGGLDSRVYVYRLSDGVQISNFNVGSEVYRVAWTPDGGRLIAFHSSSPFSTTFTVSDGVLTQEATAQPPVNTDTRGGLAISKGAGSYVLAGTNLSGALKAYQRDGGTYTLLTNPTTVPSGNYRDISYSGDGKYLGIAANAAPWIFVYDAS